MGLLNDSPYGLLGLLRNGVQDRLSNADSSSDDASDLASWARRQQQRLPLSLAGPSLIADLSQSPPSRFGSVGPLPSPADAPAAPKLSWLPRDRYADTPRPRPMPTAQNLTAQALRMKGVPEADIAATGDPERIKQLIVQNYGPASARASINRPSEPSSPNYVGDPRPRPIPTSPSLPVPLIQVANGPRCDGFPAGCHQGGTYGTTGLYSIDGLNLCQSCAIKYKKLENLGSVDQTNILRPYLE
jgi:hypothetical protein